MEIRDRIEGKKINLRFISKGDALSIYQYADDEAISRYTHIPHPYNLDDAYDFIKQTQSDRKRKTAYHYGLENKETGQIIGMIGLIALFPMHRKAELGYWLAKPFWGRGIITEAIETMVEFAFVTLKLHRVHAHVFPENTPSIRALEKCGFIREGLIREGFVQRGKYVNVYLYSILEDEWGKRSFGSNSSDSDS